MILEVFKPVKGFEDYFEISNTGRVKRLARLAKTNKGPRKIKAGFLRSRTNNSGYEEVRLTVNGKGYTTFIHRLMAQAFIPNPDCKSEINHINGIKLDNDLSNLEWVTHSENMKHAYKSGLVKKMGTPVIDTCSGKKYGSIKDASIDLKINYGACREYVNGRRKKNKTCLKYAN
jgi:hypothetical protein